MTTHNRRYDVDALRVFAFGLLILYHVGMFYVADWGWHVKSAYQAEWLQLPMQLVNQWRMPILFVISGLAVSFVWGRYSPGELARRRIVRLGLPLVFGMAFIVAPQPYYEALSKGIIEPGFLDFMAKYLTFQDFPGEAWGGEEQIVWTWNHLWYLPYVLFYTLALLPVMAWLGGSGSAVRRRLVGLRGPWLIVAPVLPLLMYGLLVFPRFPYISHALLDDWYAHAMYGTFFLYGFVIGRDDGIWREFARLRWVTLAMAIGTFALYATQDIWVPAGDGNLPGLLQSLSVYLNRWLWIVAVLGWGHHLVRGPLPGLRYATEAVFSWYILHQTITVVAGFQLSKLELGPVVEPVLVVALTVGGCLVLHEFIIRRVSWLRPLFGMPRRRGGTSLVPAKTVQLHPSSRDKPAGAPSVASESST